jgi:hypothetical protein
MDDFLDFLVMKLMLPVIVILLVLLLYVGLPYAFYSCYQKSKEITFSLGKDDWDCTKHNVFTTTTSVMSGKIMVPIVQLHDECIQWSHK